MATSYLLSQAQGTASVGSFTTVYSTSASTTAIVSNFLVANQASAVVTVRLGVDDTAGTPSGAEWLLYDVSVGGNDTLSVGPLSPGLTLGRRIRRSPRAGTRLPRLAVSVSTRSLVADR